MQRAADQRFKELEGHSVILRQGLEEKMSLSDAGGHAGAVLPFRPIVCQAVWRNNSVLLLPLRIAFDKEAANVRGNRLAKVVQVLVSLFLNLCPRFRPGLNVQAPASQNGQPEPPGADTPWRFADRASQIPRFLDDLVKQEFGGLFATTLRCDEIKIGLYGSGNFLDRPAMIQNPLVVGFQQHKIVAAADLL